VLATGFHVDAFVRPITVLGRGGVELDQVWAQRPGAYLSISVPDFPNFFMLNGPNGPVGNFSLVEVAELQLGYIMQLVERLRSGAGREISATTQAMDELEAARVEAAKNTIWSTGCRSWYLDDRGVPAVWPWPFSQFRTAMAEPRWEAYELRG
jgi:cation diffusion facilitator CzcD-associated flavoprotein CzcO